MLLRLLRVNEVLWKSLKLKIYTSITRPVVTYACETWVLTQKDEQYQRIFERKILGKFCGPVESNSDS